MTPEEVAENNCFLDAILTTGVMKVSHEFSFVTEDTELQIYISLFSILQLAHEYLLKKKLAKPNLADFKYQLYDIWFQLYPRKEGDRYVQWISAQFMQLQAWIPFITCQAGRQSQDMAWGSVHWSHTDHVEDLLVRYWWCWPLGYIAGDWHLDGLAISSHRYSSADVHPLFNPRHHLLF